ncbi:MAG: hypothetical protein AAB524_01385, partial [Patescibacteria group bacterium]
MVTDSSFIPTCGLPMRVEITRSVEPRKIEPVEFPYPPRFLHGRLADFGSVLKVATRFKIYTWVEWRNKMCEETSFAYLPEEEILFVFCGEQASPRMDGSTVSVGFDAVSYQLHASYGNPEVPKLHALATRESFEIPNNVTDAGISRWLANIHNDECMPGFCLKIPEPDTPCSMKTMNALNSLLGRVILANQCGIQGVLAGLAELIFLGAPESCGPEALNAVRHDIRKLTKLEIRCFFNSR